LTVQDTCGHFYHEAVIGVIVSDFQRKAAYQQVFDKADEQSHIYEKKILPNRMHVFDSFFYLR
jgi:hypothetical protein